MQARSDHLPKKPKGEKNRESDRPPDVDSLLTSVLVRGVQPPGSIDGVKSMYVHVSIITIYGQNS